MRAGNYLPVLQKLTLYTPGDSQLQSYRALLFELQINCARRDTQGAFVK
jgi:hypothetical protein